MLPLAGTVLIGGLVADRAFAPSGDGRCRSPDYYPRFGFAPASGFGIQVNFEVPDEALMALALDPSAETPSGTVAYPAPFGV